MKSNIFNSSAFNLNAERRTNRNEKNNLNFISKIFQSTLLIWNTTKLQSENTDLVSYSLKSLKKRFSTSD
ncbi:hypothetical protein DPV73_11450 [Leptospira mayottensis]|nr:hypothetical protein DPV73_11450 [Leptospira mayottensis]